ncbi:MAG: OmpH family outer membrane protein [Chlorobium sp.]
MKVSHRIMMATVLGLVMAAPPVFAAQEKTGVVDFGKIMQKLPETKEAESTLQTTYAKLQKESAAKNQELQKAVAEYKKQGSSLKPAAKAQKEKELNQKVQAFQKFQQEQGGLFEKKQQEISAPLRQKVITAIESIAQKEGFSVILEKNAAHYVTPENDLTFKVLDKLNIK